VAGCSLEDHFANLGLNVWPAPKSGGNFRRTYINHYVGGHFP
jgi:hypothetical protein